MQLLIGLFFGIFIGFLISSALCIMGDESKPEPTRKTKSVSNLRELIDLIDESEQTDRNAKTVDMAEDHWSR